jgi:hypothetical protein
VDRSASTFDLEDKGVVMALQSEAIDNRLEELEQDDRRVTFGSKLRAFRLDGRAKVLSGTRTSRMSRKHEGEYPIDQMVALLEDLSRRIDGLEKKDRALGDEIRLRAHQDRQRRSVRLVSEVAGLTIFIACWVMKLI